MADKLEGYFEQYSQQVGDNRIEPIMEELKEMSDPEDMMLLIMDTLKDTEVVPDAGQYYTFLYTAKTPRLTYDQHPLVAVTDIERWDLKVSIITGVSSETIHGKNWEESSMLLDPVK